MMDDLEKVKKELEKHRGKGNEISAGEIGEILGYARDDTHAKARKIIERCAQKYHIPLAANNRGYYIMTAEDELNEYKKNLKSRKKEIEKREETMEGYFREWNP